MSDGESVQRTRRRKVMGDSTALWDAAADAFTEWREGRPGAMDELVRIMTPVLWHVVRAYGLSQDIAQDVVQTTWLALVQRSGSITDPQAVAAWLTTTARRESWRARKRGDRVLSVTDDVLEWAGGDSESAEAGAVRTDEHGRLWSAVLTLSERCQRLLRVIAFEERPDYARLSRELDIPVGSIGPTRGRCLDKLRGALAETGPT